MRRILVTGMSGTGKSSVLLELPQFDEIVLLSAPVEVLLERIETRTTNAHGKTPAQRELIRRDLAEVEALLRRTCTVEIDATRPLVSIVNQLAQLGDAGGDRPEARPRGRATYPVSRA